MVDGRCPWVRGFWLAGSHRLGATTDATRRRPLCRRGLGDGAVRQLAGTNARYTAFLSQATAVLLAHRRRKLDAGQQRVGRSPADAVVGHCRGSCPFPLSEKMGE